MDWQQGKVRHFVKLGYSQSDILRVLKSLDHGAQTNEILEELIKTCRTTGVGLAGAERAPSGGTLLVPRGCSSPQQHVCADAHGQQHATHDASCRFRPVVIDGSNVAISHGNKQVFSCRGIQLAVQWFWDRGIRDITVFVPLWRKEQSRPEAPITDQHILNELESRNILVYTPSRCIKGKRVVCYDDRYIVKLAYDSDGIIVSNDNYRDLQLEKPQWKKFIEERLLMYTFVNDMFMPPDDPLGRNGPTIENFLRKKPTGSENKHQHCPYGKKCTYGVKCKFYHPERSKQTQLSVADELRAKSQPVSDTKESSPATHLTNDPFPNTFLRYTDDPANDPTLLTTHEAAFLQSAMRPDDLACILSNLDLYNSPRDTTRSPTNLQRSLPSLCNSEDDDSSMESFWSRPYYSDSALQTSVASSSRCVAGNGSDHCLSSCSHTVPRRAHTPEPSRPHFRSGTESFSPCLHAYCDMSLSYAHTPHPLYGHKSHNPYNSVAPWFYQEPLRYSAPSGLQGSYGGSPEVNWARHPAGDSDEHEQVTDRRRDVRAQLSTLFPHNIVDRVMSMHPHTLDTAELITLVLKYRNSQIAVK
ncbi:uncharacterized protein LOC143522679 [Brachyhypopomus gauderio]|uniref:uncharacterized protein LOC143522679 n=1 Tax=Brachyhypopomus gauderio TaxID=698409 RepID=UPI004040F255